MQTFNDRIQTISLQIQMHDCDPSLPNYGKMRDAIHRFNFTMQAGRAYGFIGDCGSGGWLISYALSGRTSILEGRIIVDGRELTQKDLQQVSWYLGDYVGVSRVPFRTLSVRKLLIKSLQSSNSRLSFDSVVELFDLSPTRLDRAMHSIGNERWHASAAIGFSLNRQIYCFPWLNKSFMKWLFPRIEFITKILTEHGCTVILPTSDRQAAEKLGSHLVELEP